MEYRVSRFPMLSRFFLTANEKDFSLSLEMTVWESGILASFPSPAGKALVRGCGSPSFLWKEVPRRGRGWLTQRNKKEWIRSIFLYRPPKHSRGRFFVNRSLFPARMKRRDLKAYGVRRFPFSDALLFLLDRKRKRFLAHARNDGTGGNGILASLPYSRHNKMPQIPCGYPNTKVEFTAINFLDICHVYLDRG